MADCYQRALGLNPQVIDKEGRFATMNNGATTLRLAGEKAAEKPRGQILGSVPGLNGYRAGLSGPPAW